MAKGKCDITKAIEELLYKCPKVGSMAYADYIDSHKKIRSLLCFILHLVGSADATHDIASKALLKSYGVDSEEGLKLKCKIDSRITMAESLKKHRQVLLEIFYSKFVDNYLNYISSLLYEIYTKKPETMKSNEKVDFSIVVECNSKFDLLKSLAEIKTSKLTYKPYSDICEYFENSFGVKIYDKYSSEIVIANEIRNIIVHNRCVVDVRFVSKTKDKKHAVGSQYHLYIGDLDKIEFSILETVINTDISVRRHLKMRGHRCI